MKFLKLSCIDPIVGPKNIKVDILGKPTDIWIVEGFGSEIKYDSDGNITVVSPPASMRGIFVYPAYRNLTVDPNDPTGDLIFGVSEVDSL